MQADLSEDLLSFLNEGPLLADDLETPNIEDLAFLTSDVQPPSGLDHQYSRSPLESESSVPYSGSEGVASPTHSNSSQLDSPLHQVFSEDPKDSPRSTDSDGTMPSPLGTGVEDLQMSDINFQTLDASYLLQDDLFLTSLTDNSNIAVDMGES